MKRLILALLMVAIVTSTALAQSRGSRLSSGSFIQNIDRLKKDVHYKALYLAEAIEQGLRKNYEQKLRDYSKDLIDLNLLGAKLDFWYPKVKLELTTSTQNAGFFVKRSKGYHHSHTPYGVFGVEIEDYTLFNWGKDFISYLNTKDTYERERELLDDYRRDLKQDIIVRFFELLMYKKIEKVTKEQLRHAAFIYRYNKERVALQKTSKQEYYLSRAEYLRSQSEFQEAMINSEAKDVELATIIDDPAGTRYIIRQDLNFKKMRITLDDALEIAKVKHADIKSAQKDLLVAKRSYDLALKEDLPLPKFTVDLGAYQHSFGNGAHNTEYSTSSGDSIEIVASINASWDLFGSDGFLNARKRKRAMINWRIAQHTLEKAHHTAASGTRENYVRAVHYEDLITVLEARVSNIQRAFDVVLENYMNKKATFHYLREYLQEQADAQIDLEMARFNHVKYKVLTAKAMGMDDFPGEDFEHLATRRKEQ